MGTAEAGLSGHGGREDVGSDIAAQISSKREWEEAGAVGRVAGWRERKEGRNGRCDRRRFMHTSARASVVQWILLRDAGAGVSLPLLIRFDSGAWRGMVCTG